MGGFFGTVAMADCVADVFYGTDYHSHMGTRRGGMATYHAEAGTFTRSIHNLESSYFRTKFEPSLSKFEGSTSGIGVISDTDAQPLIIHSHLGEFAIVTVAKINNLDALAEKLLQHHNHFAELSSGKINQTELIALLLIQGKDFVDGIENVFRHIDGSCSMLLLTRQGLIAARDDWGRTPIVIGRKEGAWAVASESSCFPNLGYDTYRDLGPGEIVHIDRDGVKCLRQPSDHEQICSFLWVYYGFPTSTYLGRNVEHTRYTNGVMMAERDETENPDIVCGIPDSGVGMALGYAAGLHKPYSRAISKYTPTWPRSFTPSNQSMRSLVAKMKLIPNRDILRNKSVLFCDDSIVRGTQLRDNVKVLFEDGAKAIHMRIACPPLIYGCPFIGFTSSKSDLELITRRIIGEIEGDPHTNLERYAIEGSPEQLKMIDMIRQRLGLTTLKFNRLSTMVEAIGLPKCRLCTHCFDGTGCCGKGSCK